MLNIGRKQTLVVVRTVKFGVYLAENETTGETERVLLPAKQVPEGTKVGDHLEVFLYRDSSDRMIATTNEPKITLGKVALLQVVQTSNIGAFLDWGLEKDLFLPFKQQTRKPHPGEEVLVGLYVDKSGRLAATMKVYHFLGTNSPYVVGDEAEGRIYEISSNFGVFVAIDDKYSALIPKREAQAEYKIGEIIKCRITEVKEDGKLTLSARKKTKEQIEIDAESVLSVIEEFAGVLPFDDKASPEIIQREFGLSKASFKRAVGHLMKQGLVEVKNGHIRIVAE